MTKEAPSFLADEQGFDDIEQMTDSDSDSDSDSDNE
jgi:hypothetical protein